MKVGIFYSRVRVEEKWILQALEQRGIEFDCLDDRRVVFELAGCAGWQQYDVVLERSVSYKNSLYTTKILNSLGVPTINSYEVVATCGDKLATTAALEQAGVPQPKVWVAFTPEAALEAIEAIGYPVVL